MRLPFISRTFFALAIYVFLSGSTTIAEAADDLASLPIRVPPGWQLTYDKARERIAVWDAMTASGIHSGYLLTYAAKGQLRDTLPEVQSENAVHCGTVFSVKRTEMRLSGPEITQPTFLEQEEVSYTYDTVPFLISYIFPRDGADARIESLLKEACPSEIPFLEAPVGWNHMTDSGDVGGVGVVWAAPYDSGRESASGIVFLVTTSPGATLTPADFAFINRNQRLFPKPLAFHRNHANAQCNAPLYFANSVVAYGTSFVREHVALSKGNGRLYVAFTLDSTRALTPDRVAAVDSVCADHPFPMHWLRSPTEQ